ncbi:MAG: hypothetical protein J6T70_08095, partial [Bacteroidales bacterium]|nr:hypothetical protein [Bacteroidales bacterium]
MAHAGLDAIYGEITLRNVLYLVVSLVLTANLKEIFAIYKEIALLWITDIEHQLHLIEEKRLTQSANV